MSKMNGSERLDCMLTHRHYGSDGDRVCWDMYIKERDAIARDLDTPIRWRPIGEAPPDRELLLWCGREFEIGSREDGESEFYDRGGMRIFATHFCPLTPPEPTP